MRPYDVNTEEHMIAMSSDNHPQDAECWSILNFADKVSLHPPADSDWVGWVEIPRDQFNAIVDWYMKDQASPSPEPNVIPSSVRDFLGKVQGVCMGVAMSGDDHPNPDGALMELVEEAQAILFPTTEQRP